MIRDKTSFTAFDVFFLLILQILNYLSLSLLVVFVSFLTQESPFIKKNKNIGRKSSLAPAKKNYLEKS